MFRTLIKRTVFIGWAIIGFFLVTSLYAPTLQAAAVNSNVSIRPTATPTVVLSQPGVSGQFEGHPGTLIGISGSGFTAGEVLNLYTTSDNAEQCGAGTNNLQEFTSLTVKTDGTFQLPATTTWPASADTTNTTYYICAINANSTERAISAASFIVAPPVTAVASATTVNPGDQVTISGDNWLPAQTLTVAIMPTGQTSELVNGQTTPDNTGHFSLTLTFPANTAPGNYNISVVANNEVTLKFEQDNAIVVSAIATAAPTVAPTPTPTIAPTPTPTATVAVAGNGGTTNSGSSGPSGMSILIFALGGLGILMVVVGIIMFAAYSRAAPI